MKDFLKGAIYVGLFAVPFLTLYVENDFFFPFITGKNFAFRIIVEVVLGLWVLLALVDKDYRPKFSWILASFTALIGTMAVSTAISEHFVTAFWSNFERMDGYITLLHMYAYFVVLASVMRSKEVWIYFLRTSVIVASFVALKGLSQFAAADGGSRVDSTLGNAAYMAVYMLFHLFILAYLATQTRDILNRIVYGLLGVMFVFVLLQTGTRGTFIGLLVGSFVTIAYIALFAIQQKQIRRYAVGSVVALILLIAGFMSVKDAAYIQNSPALSRIANINVMADLQTRSMIWAMSFEGIKERPLFGWGSGNFNYVFNSQYDPRIYSQEQWFDRVHNIFFDWLIAGGVFGFIAYFSLFAAILYYLLWRPYFKNDTSFTVFERAVLIGLVAGYLTHNLVVFDNIVSYIFFGVILALIHSRVGQPIQKLQKVSIPNAIIIQVCTPVVAVLIAVTVYVCNVPGIVVAGELIDGFRYVNTDPSTALTHFKNALNEESFATQEVTEQVAQQAMNIMRNPAISNDVKAAYATLAEENLNRMVKEKPGDARLHVFFSGFYRSANQLEKAKEHIDIARSLSPNKQAIILQQGAIALAQNNMVVARDYFKYAYELDTRNEEALEFYLASLFYLKETETANVLLEQATDTFKDRLARNDFFVGAVHDAGDFGFLADLYERRVVTENGNPQEWASLAFVYYQLKDVDKAVNTLDRAAKAFPSFAPTAACFANNITAGRDPQLGCVATTTPQTPNL